MKNEVKSPWQHKQTSLITGERKYRVKKEALSKLEKASLTQFEKHMIQEGIKQVLFCAGTEDVWDRDAETSFRRVPKETIQFLLDYEVIEEYDFK